MRLRWKCQRTIVPGQAIVIRTDGLWEMRNTGDGMFGEDAFPEIIGANPSAPASTILQAITHALCVGTVLGTHKRKRGYNMYSRFDACYHANRGIKGNSPFNRGILGKSITGQLLTVPVMGE